MTIKNRNQNRRYEHLTDAEVDRFTRMPIEQFSKHIETQYHRLSRPVVKGVIATNRPFKAGYNNGETSLMVKRSNGHFYRIKKNALIPKGGTPTQDSYEEVPIHQTELVHAVTITYLDDNSKYVDLCRLMQARVQGR